MPTYNLSGHPAPTFMCNQTCKSVTTSSRSCVLKSGAACPMNTQHEARSPLQTPSCRDTCFCHHHYQHLVCSRPSWNPFSTRSAPQTHHAGALFIPSLHDSPFQRARQAGYTSAARSPLSRTLPKGPSSLSSRLLALLLLFSSSMSVTFSMPCSCMRLGGEPVAHIHIASI